MALPEIHAQMVDESKREIAKILMDCGVKHDELTDNGLDDGLTPAELEARMGRVWVTLGRAGALKARWKALLAEKQDEFEIENARAYGHVSEELPRGTETAKKNKILLDFPAVVEKAKEIREVEYVVDMCNIAVRAVENRVNMLQSINKAKVSEMENLHVHLRDPGSTAARGS